MKRLIAVALMAGLTAFTATADTLRLKNGDSIDGTYVGGNSRDVKFISSDGRVISYSVSDVAAIEFVEATEEPTASEAITAPQPIEAPMPPTTTATNSVAIPDGTVVTVRTIDSIDSDTTGVGERYLASLEDAIVVDGIEVAPRGADAILSIAKVEQAGRIRGRDEVAIELVAIKMDGEERAVTSNFAELESKSKTKQTAKTAGAGAAIGALIGAIAGGGKGAAIGAGVGGGAGTVYSATRGTSVQVPSETLMTFVIRAQ